MTDDQMIRIALTGAAASLVALFLARRKSELPTRKTGAATRLAYRLGKLWGARRGVPAAPAGKVKMRTLIGLANSTLRHDGLAVKVDLQTTDGDIEIEIPVAEFASIIDYIARLAIEAGRHQGLPINADSPAQYSVEIPTKSIMLAQIPNGGSRFLFRVGVLNVAFPFDSQAMAQNSEALMAALQGIAATDRARRKP